MKKILLLFVLVLFIMNSIFSQSSKAELKKAKKLELSEKFNKAVAAIDARDFVIVVDNYRSNSNGIWYNTVDNTNFFSYEQEFAYVQGAIFFGVGGYPDSHKLEVIEFSKSVDSKGNVTVKMYVKGNLTQARVEIFIKEGDSSADVIYTMRGCELKYSGEVLPTAESNYFKRVTKV